MAKALSHWWYEKGFSPVCNLSWVFSLQDLQNDLSQIEQEKSFSEGLLRCVFSLSWQTKALSHWRQGYGFSPVWVRMGIFKLKYWVKDCSQLEQGKGFLPEWVSLCLFRLPDWEKDLTQALQEKHYSTVWVLSCDFSWLEVENVLLQTVQEKDFSPEWLWLWTFSLLGVWKILWQAWQLCCMVHRCLGGTNWWAGQGVIFWTRQQRKKQNNDKLPYILS